MELPITSTIAACLALIALSLSLNISARRGIIGNKSGVVHKAVFGDAGDELLRNSIRAFGNFIEYTPLALILFMLVELQGGYETLLWIVAIAFLIGRIIHGLSMTFILLIPAPRGLAMIPTYVAYAFSAWILLQG